MKTRREFVQSSLCVGASAFLPFHPQSLTCGHGQDTSGAKPNTVFILADDMGFSDIGCYGSEIAPASR